MGKLIFKVVVMLVIVVGASNYAMYLMTGQTPLSNLSLPKMPGGAKLEAIAPAGSQTAYKWTDDKGVVHYSSEAPAQTGVEKIEVDPNTNLVQGLRMPDKPDAKDAKAPEPSLPQGHVYSRENIEKVMSDAKKVKELMDQRAADSEKLFNEE